MPAFTIALILVNLAVYALEQASGVQGTCETYGLIPSHFTHSGAISPIFTAMFLHANLTHLVGNMVFLAVFGTIVERELGHVRFVVLYFASGVGGALLHVAVDPSATNAMVGASGCLFGIIALAAINNPRLLGFAVSLAGLNIWYSLGGTGSDISFGAHLGGLATGVLFGVAARFTENTFQEGTS